VYFQIQFTRRPILWIHAFCFSNSVSCSMSLHHWNTNGGKFHKLLRWILLVTHMTAINCAIMRAENVSSGQYEMYSVHSPQLSGTALNICGIWHSNFACKFIFCRIQRRPNCSRRAPMQTFSCASVFFFDQEHFNFMAICPYDYTSFYWICFVQQPHLLLVLHCFT
jgi:hypothetical protein